MYRLILSSFALATLLHAELFTEHFNTGVVKSRIEYKDGTRTRTSKGIKHGVEKVYYETGELAYEVKNVDGQRDGTLTWYDRDGNVLEILHYQHGKRHGVNKLFFSDGTLRSEVTYLFDKREGPYREYFSNGDLALKVTYKNGRKEGIQTEYHPGGKIASKVRYVNGYKEGEQQWYDRNGTLIKTEMFKMDRSVEVLKQLRKKEPDATETLLKGLDFNPQHHRAQ
ncbi:MAG: toxin-antitoxin system YwqK family antitoxin [Sulfurovum sp.]|nr:toxin-antitoxin system YwqK family antitoxin [Sulfurovum sp.]